MVHSYQTIVCLHCGEWIRVPVYCGNRFCEVCSHSRQRIVREKIKYLISRANFTGGYFLGMVTLSLPNTPNIDQGVKDLVRYFRRLRHSKLWKRSIRGGVFVIEITGTAGNYHPHIHALVEQKFISWSRFQLLWKSITGATAFHIKKVPSGAAERYLTKYIAKPDVAPELVADIAVVLRHVRMFQPFGSWHGLLAGFSKPQYPCPVCGELCWIPWDSLFHNKKPGRVVERAPPRGLNGCTERENRGRWVFLQAVMAPVLAPIQYEFRANN